MFRSSDSRTTRTSRALLASLLLGVSTASLAQQGADSQEMTLQELEAYIAEQKAALETVQENRDLTERKADAVQEALDDAAAREAEVQQELDALCEERESVEPGSLESCLDENSG